MNDSVVPKYKSGGQEIERFVMHGKQDFDSDQSQWPLYQPISKIEGKIQASGLNKWINTYEQSCVMILIRFIILGEAEYVNDIPIQFGELFGAYVLTTVANAKLQKVDASEALVVLIKLKYK